MVEIAKEELERREEGELVNLSPGVLHYLFIAIGYYAQAIKSGKKQIGWDYVIEGRYWHGMLVGITQEHNLELIKLSDKANDARHVENRKIKKEFLKWYRDHEGEHRTQKEALLTASEIFSRSFATLERHLKGR